MSDVDVNPVELVLQGAIETGQVFEGIELLLPREVPLGGPRAMPVLRSLPNKYRHFIGAWCFADHYGPVDLEAAHGMDVQPHPHTGLQTVSWLIRGDVVHRDSIGSVSRIAPGAVNLMTAGRGISHSEVSPDAGDRDPLLHGVQLWVALPEAVRDRAPAFASAGGAELPTVVLEHAGAGGSGIVATVFLGEYFGQAAPGETHTPIVGAELRFTSCSDALLPLEARFEHGILACSPGIRVDDVELPVGTIGYLPAGRERVAISAGDDGIAILLGGEPFDEEIVMFWNFVGSSHDEVRAAREEWQAEIEADLTSAARPRFGVVEGHGRTVIPAPELPTVPLRPRGRVREQREQEEGAAGAARPTGDGGRASEPGAGASGQGSRSAAAEPRPGDPPASSA